jgi:hypothetical protein
MLETSAKADFVFQVIDDIETGVEIAPAVLQDVVYYKKLQGKGLCAQPGAVKIAGDTGDDGRWLGVDVGAMAADEIKRFNNLG